MGETSVVPREFALDYDQGPGLDRSFIKELQLASRPPVRVEGFLERWFSGISVCCASLPGA